MSNVTVKIQKLVPPLTGWGGTGTNELNALLQGLTGQKVVSVAGAAANTAIPLPGVVGGDSVITNVVLYVTATGMFVPSPPTPQLYYDSVTLETYIKFAADTTADTIQVVVQSAFGGADFFNPSGISRSSHIGKGIGANAVPAPAQANPSGQQQNANWRLDAVPAPTPLSDAGSP